MTSVPVPQVKSDGPKSQVRARASSAVTRTLRTGRGAIGLVVLAGGYEFLRQVGVLPRDSTPATWSMVSTLVSGLSDGSLTGPLEDTVVAWALGLLSAVAIGVPLGAATGMSRWANAVTGPAVEFLRPVPAVALVPVGILMFGLETGLQVFLVAFATVWPLLTGSRHGVQAVDPLFLDSARALGQSRTRVLYRVVLPAALPALMTGLRTAAGIGVVVAVAVEIVSGSPGLGFYLNAAEQAGQVPEAFAAVLLAGLLGLAVDVVARTAENRLAGWQRHITEDRR
ncbi:ABC transporter permease subunit [Streptomyces sp. NPDC026672]|uniref:ABC transporter permease n=1 Tax=unclassified Streptomyces TaxID=2593676 RepID=UPI0034007F74